jgi:hypothetical protein
MIERLAIYWPPGRLRGRLEFRAEAVFNLLKRRDVRGEAHKCYPLSDW